MDEMGILLTFTVLSFALWTSATVLPQVDGYSDFGEQYDPAATSQDELEGAQATTAVDLILGTTGVFILDWIVIRPIQIVFAVIIARVGTDIIPFI